MVCLSCTGKTIEEDLSLISASREFIDIAEIRADFLDPPELSRLSEIPAKARIPCVLTFRKPEDGGVNNKIDDETRCSILYSALTGGFSYIDIEDNAAPAAEKRLISAAEERGMRVIKSFHDFDGVSDDILERIKHNAAGGRYISKAAVMPKGTADFLKIVEVFNKLNALADEEDSAGFDFILLGMGSYGFPTRVLSSFFGSLWTFTSAGEVKAAPGQITPHALAGDYSFSSIDADTRVYGIIGSPVMHSNSPQLHNTWFKKNNMNAVYLPFETDDPALFLKKAPSVGVYGLSVTIPHKQKVIELAGRVDESVHAVGACNTLVLDTERQEWIGYNTDWKGFLKPVAALFLTGRSALVIGAGGAARAVVYALINRGMNVTIVNRTQSRAEMLAGEFGCGYAPLDDAGSIFKNSPKEPFLVVQTTSVGMSPDTDADPAPKLGFSGREIVYDIIYHPAQTAFLKRAARAGCRTINGAAMLEAQAAEQFLLFTGIEPESGGQPSGCE